MVGAALLMCGATLGLAPNRGSSLGAEDAGRPASTADGGASMTRPQRGSSGIFDDASDGVGTPSAEWRAATQGIVGDMRAHLERRKTNADADVIRSNRGPIMQAILGFHDFLKSKALGNVFRSLGLFLGAWLWYVFNTQPRPVRRVGRAAVAEGRGEACRRATPLSPARVHSHSLSRAPCAPLLLCSRRNTYLPPEFEE